jgi:hypothetical protein
MDGYLFTETYGAFRSGGASIYANKQQKLDRDLKKIAILAIKLDVQ